MTRRGTPASAYAFDTLIAGLVEAFEGARRAAQAQYASQLQSFAVSSTRRVGPAEAGVSVANLLAFRQMRVRDLAIEFDCALHPAGDSPTLQLVLSSPPFWRKPRLHRVRIEIADGSQPQGQVSIDGHLLKRFTAEAAAPFPSVPV